MPIPEVDKPNNLGWVCSCAALELGAHLRSNPESGSEYIERTARCLDYIIAGAKHGRHYSPSFMIDPSIQTPIYRALKQYHSIESVPELINHVDNLIRNLRDFSVRKETFTEQKLKILEAICGAIADEWLKKQEREYILKIRMGLPIETCAAFP